MADIGSRVEGQFGFHRPAAGTGLAAWIPAVDDMQSCAGVGALVFEHASEHAEPLVEDFPVQPAFARLPVRQVLARAPGILFGLVASAHALHVQVLDADVTIGGGEHRGGLVEHVAALVGGSVGELRVLPFGFDPAFRALVATAEPAAQSPLLAGDELHAVRVGDHGAVRQGCERSDSQIDADATFQIGCRLRFVAFDAKAGVPASAFMSDGHARDSRVAHESAHVLHAMHAAYARQFQAVIVGYAETAGRVREPGCGLRPFARTRPAHAPSLACPAATVEIVGERVGQGLETSIVGLLAVLIPPWGDFTFPFVPPAAQRGHRPVGPALALYRRAAAQLASNMQQGDVEREAGGARMRPQRLFLPWGRIQRDLDALTHGRPLSAWLRLYVRRRASHRVVRRTRSAPRSCRAPNRHPAPCHPPR